MSVGDENNDNIFAIAQEACALDLFPILAICLPKLDFEVQMLSPLSDGILCKAVLTVMGDIKRHERILRPS